MAFAVLERLMQRHLMAQVLICRVVVAFALGVGQLCRQHISSPSSADNNLAAGTCGYQQAGHDATEQPLWFDPM
jgi:hypothetical protein